MTIGDDRRSWQYQRIIKSTADKGTTTVLPSWTRLVEGITSGLSRMILMGQSGHAYRQANLGEAISCSHTNHLRSAAQDTVSSSQYLSGAFSKTSHMYMPKNKKCSSRIVCNFCSSLPHHLHYSCSSP